MEIKNAQNRENWDNWLKENIETAPFQQSWEWGDILLAEGEKVERLVISEGNEVLAQAQIIYKPLPFGWSYAFCAKGPVFENCRMQNAECRILYILINYLKQKRYIFFRIEPISSSVILQSKIKILQSLDINPRATSILNLQKSDEEILEAMRKNTRYSIRFASKQNLVVEEEKNFAIFWDLLQQTAKHDNFTTHSKKHYLEIFNSNSVFQLTAYKSDKPIAVAVFVGFGNTFTYLFAASDYAEHRLLAPYLLQWEAIKLGKNLGYKFYDFFGIAPATTPRPSLVRRGQPLPLPEGEPAEGEGAYKYDSHHPYAGITRFKLGFGGEIKESPGTFDVVIEKREYLVYKILRFIRRLF